MELNLKKIILIMLIMLSLNAQALESIVGKVTLVEATYLPGSISFYMDTGNATCPKGKWFKWSKNEENNKIVYSTLMTALVSGKKVRLYINDNDTSCKGQFLHILAG
ncbi:hypothetical protein H4J52_05800 [Colwellia sp. MB02u-14]|nr:hypothetical protein [Colwellia sp. MB02u-14]